MYVGGQSVFETVDREVYEAVPTIPLKWNLTSTKDTFFQVPTNQRKHFLIPGFLGIFQANLFDFSA